MKVLFWTQLDPAFSRTRPDAISNGAGTQRAAQDKNFAAHLGEGCGIHYLDARPCSLLVASVCQIAAATPAPVIKCCYEEEADFFWLQGYVCMVVIIKL